MTGEQLRLLNYMKKLIREGKMKFEDRADRDYQKDLFEIGITEHEAWFKHIIYLRAYDYIPDYRPYYRSGGDALIFKKSINGIIVYIKLKLEEGKTVCLSFHRDNGGNIYDM